MKRLPRIKLKCPVCTKEFNIIPSRINKCKTHCCSVLCKNRFNVEDRASKMRIREYPAYMGDCEFCGKQIMAENAQFVKIKRRFCSNTCKSSDKNKKWIWTDKAKEAISKANKGRKHKARSLEHRENHRQANLGSKSHFWKGGITKKTQQYRCCAKAREFRTKVFERDNYTCVVCNARSKKGHAIILNADHIKPWSFFPELRYDIDNGRTLCLDCHKKTDSFGSKAIKNYSKNK